MLALSAGRGSKLRPPNRCPCTPKTRRVLPRIRPRRRSKKQRHHLIMSRRRPERQRNPFITPMRQSKRQHNPFIMPVRRQERHHHQSLTSRRQRKRHRHRFSLSRLQPKRQHRHELITSPCRFQALSRTPPHRTSNRGRNVSPPNECGRRYHILPHRASALSVGRSSGRRRPPLQ